MKIKITAALMLVLFFFTGCSAAFDASINGVIVDMDDYENDPDSTGIENVRVYLYLKDRDRQRDFEDWRTDDLRPDELKLDEKGEEIDKRHVDMAITNGTGTFSFVGVWWVDYFPEFGSDASVEPGYLLIYHPDYGMISYESTIRLYGDGRTRDLGPFPIQKAINEAMIKGRVLDMNVTENGQPLGLAGVSVDIYTTDSWSVTDGVVTVENDDWKKEPTYTVLSDSEGYFEQTVSFRKFLGNSSEELIQTKMRIVFSRTGYSQFCLAEDANNKYSGFVPAGTEYVGDRTVDLQDPANWVLFDGPVATVNYWNGSAQDSETVGLAGGMLKKDFDQDADGIEDIYYELVVPAATQRGEVIELAHPIRMRNIRLQAEVAGRVFADTGTTGPDNGVWDDDVYAAPPPALPVSTADTYENGATVTFDWFSAGDTIGTTVTDNKIISDQVTTGNAIEEGHYSFSINWTSYNYEGATANRQIWISATLPNGATTLSSANSAVYTPDQVVQFSPVEAVKYPLDIPLF